MPTPKTRSLYSGEDEYFKKNPHVAGMAAEDNQVILNPYSKLSPDQMNNVYVNEMARLYMRNNNTPPLSLTNEQQGLLSGTTYAKANDVDRSHTILARILSGDTSGGIPTMEQSEALKPMLYLRGLLNY